MLKRLLLQQNYNQTPLFYEEVERMFQDETVLYSEYYVIFLLLALKDKEVRSSGPQNTQSSQQESFEIYLVEKGV